MEDKAKYIFGNKTLPKDYRRAVRSKQKLSRRFGDDSAADYPVTIRIFDKCDRITVDYNQLYAYCKRDGSITTTSSFRNAFDQIANAEEVFLYLKESHPDLEPLAARILLSAALGYLLKTDEASTREYQTERESAFAIIRKYYRKETKAPILSIYQRILLFSANAGKWQFAVASWIYRSIHRLLAS